MYYCINLILGWVFKETWDTLSIGGSKLVGRDAKGTLEVSISSADLFWINILEYPLYV